MDGWKKYILFIPKQQAFPFPFFPFLSFSFLGKAFVNGACDVYIMMMMMMESFESLYRKCFK